MMDHLSYPTSTDLARPGFLLSEAIRNTIKSHELDTAGRVLFGILPLPLALCAFIESREEAIRSSQRIQNVRSVRTEAVRTIQEIEGSDLAKPILILSVQIVSIGPLNIETAERALLSLTTISLALRAYMKLMELAKSERAS